MTVTDLFIAPEPWTAQALCAQVDSDMFFPEKGGSPKDAQKVCHDCDVKTECLQYALDNDERFGVWGELTERQRRRLKRALQGEEVPDTSHCINGHNRAQVGVSPAGDCRQCARDREQRYKTRIKQGLVQPLPHGTRSRYQLGCRCDPCRAASAAYMRRRRGRPLSLTPGAGL
jgi:WhiB family redox-sensing transcriptional regulator